MATVKFVPNDPATGPYQALFRNGQVVMNPECCCAPPDVVTCEHCVDSIAPRRWLLEFSNLTAGSLCNATTCTASEGQYILTYTSGCTWQLSVTTMCALLSLVVTLSDIGGGQKRLTMSASFVEYRKDFAGSIPCLELVEEELTQITNLRCPGTLKITALF